MPAAPSRHAIAKRRRKSDEAGSTRFPCRGARHARDSPRPHLPARPEENERPVELARHPFPIAKTWDKRRVPDRPHRLLAESHPGWMLVNDARRRYLARFIDAELQRRDPATAGRLGRIINSVELGLPRGAPRPL